MTNDKVNREFRQFGDKMYYILILFIIGLIPGISAITGIITLYLSIKILSDIKSANKELKKKELDNFRTNFISSYILLLIIGILIIITVVFAVIAMWPLISVMMQTQIPPTPEQMFAILPSLIIPGILLLICLVLVLIVGILRYLAWGEMTEFFIENSGLFPEEIAHDARKGAENMKTASLCMILGFLVITLIIGLIYEIMGYIKLAKLRNLPYSSPQATSQTSSTPAPRSSSAGHFCPFCGAKTEEAATFCASCGQQL